MQIPDSVRNIQAYSRGQYVFMASQRRDPDNRDARGMWVERPIDASSGSEFILDPSTSIDLYFSPLRFTASVRSNTTVGAPGVLFADLDPVRPWELELMPSVAWATSPGMYQAVWTLDSPVTGIAGWSEINRSVTQHTGADRGGWMASKMLRVPGSFNHKRNAPGIMLWDDGPTYSLTQVLEVWPVVGLPRASSGEDYPDVMSRGLAAALTASRWGLIGLRGRAMLMEEGVQDRSLHIVRTAHELVKTIDPDEVFHMMWWRPWMKWRTDRDRPEQLWAEILRAAEDK